MHHIIAAYAVFFGAGHVLEWVCDEWRSRNMDCPPLGVPVREAWPEPVWRPVQEVMDRVYESGVAEAVAMPHGVVTIVPYPAEGPPQGVVSVHVRPQRQAPLRQVLDRLPALR